MNIEGASGLSICQILRQDHHHMNLESLKRRVRPSLDPTGRGEASYPSPPMSNPPSPLEYPQDEHTHPVATSDEQSTSASRPALSTSMPGVALSAPTPASSFFRAPTLSAHLPSLSAAAPISSSAGFSLQRPHASSSSTSNVLQGPQDTQPAGRPSSSRGGRKSKAHVASACINCKKAHLSCDVNRPCARCVASGKQVRLLARLRFYLLY